MGLPALSSPSYGFLHSFHSKQRYNELFTRQRKLSNSAEIRKKARQRRETQENNKNYQKVAKCKPVHDEADEDKSRDAGTDSVDGDSLFGGNESSSSESDKETIDSEGAEKDDNEEDVAAPCTTSSAAVPLAQSSPGQEPSCDETSEPLELAVSVYEAEPASDKTTSSLHRVLSVPTLSGPSFEERLLSLDPNSLQRSSSLRGRKRLSDTELWKGIQSSSAEHVNECDAKTSLWEAIEKSEKEFSEKEQARIKTESKEDGPVATAPPAELESLESEVQEQVDETENSEVQMKKPDVEIGKMETKEDTEAKVDTNEKEVVLRRPRPYVGVPKEIMEVAESGLVKRRSRNFEERRFNIEVDIEDDLLNSREEEENCEVMETATEPSEEEKLNTKVEVSVAMEEQQEEQQEAEQEDPKPGLVRKQTQEFEQLYCGGPQAKHAGSKAGILEDEIEDEKVSEDAQVSDLDADGICTQGCDGEAGDSVERNGTESETPAEPQDASFPAFEVKVEALVKKINDEMKKEVCIRKSTAKTEHEPCIPVSKEAEEIEESSTDDTGAVREGEHGKDTKKEQTSDASEEVPRPGLVKRNTLLLEEKARELLALEIERARKLPPKEEPIQTEGEPTRSDASLVPSDSSLESEADRVECVEVRDAKVSQEEEEEESGEQSTGWLEQNAGLVKRHKLMIEGRLQTRDPETKTQSVADEEQVVREEEEMPLEQEVLCQSPSDLPSVRDADLKGAPTEPLDGSVEETGINFEAGDEAISLVKRHTLLIEERLQSNQEEPAKPPPTDEYTKSQEGSNDTLNKGEEPEEALDTGDTERVLSSQQLESVQTEIAVDTSSVVNVRTHAQLLEERLREASGQLAADADEGVEKHDSDTHSHVIIFPLSSQECEKNPEIPSFELDGPAVETAALELIQPGLDPVAEAQSDWSVGNVKQRTLALEKLMLDVAKAARVFEQFKSDPKSKMSQQRRPVLRRNESLRTSRSVDTEFGGRRRSFSDVGGSDANKGGLVRADPSASTNPSAIRDATAETSGSLPKDWRLKRDNNVRTTVDPSVGETGV